MNQLRKADQFPIDIQEIGQQFSDIPLDRPGFEQKR
jgi:hypothetical protein